MDIVLYSRPQSSYTAEDVAALFDALDRSGMGWRVNKDFASLAESLAGRSFAPDELYDDASQIDDRAQVMVSYGGDGTFLDCVRMLGGRPVPIIGINSGRLGFLANVSKRHLETAFRDLREGNYSVVSRTLIRAEGDFGSSPEYPFAFNELAIQRQSPNMISTTVFVNDESHLLGRRGAGLHSCRVDGLFAQRRRPGRRAGLPLLSDLADRSAQSDDAARRHSRYGRHPNLRSNAGYRFLRLARQSDLFGRGRGFLSHRQGR